MGRRKVRKHQSKQYYERMLEEYFDKNGEEVIADMLNKLGYDSLESLQYHEQNMAFGFDCGWTKLIPRDNEMYHEWELDNGKYCAEIFCRPTYYPQSTTVQRVQVEKAVKDLGLSDKFYVSTRLD